MGTARKRQVSSSGEVTYTALVAVRDDGSLGNNTKSVDTGYQTRRAKRYELQAHAAKLLPGQRVAKCMKCCGSGGVAVRYSSSTGTAGYGGVFACGSVWACPVCASKISNQRKEELNTALQVARNLGHKPMLLTLTMRHSIDDSLRGSLERLKRAKRRFHQSRAWRAIQASLVGHITATEVTHGSSGWHPHFHILLFFGVDFDGLGVDCAGLVESARDAWTRSLLSEGLTCNDFGYQAQDADQAGEYVAKWGAGEEMTLTANKEGRGGRGRSPLQLLDDYGRGDEEAGRLYQEFAKEFHGKRQLVWSKGFKRILAIAEKSDEELAEAPEAEDMADVAIIDRETWGIVVRRRLQAELLAVTEEGAQVGQASHYIDCWVHALWLQLEHEVFDVNQFQEDFINGCTSEGQ